MKKILLLIVFLLAIPIIMRIMKIKDINSHITAEYYTTVKSDNYDISNFGDFRFAIRKYENTNEFLYDRKERKILYENISKYIKISNCVYVISNTNQNVLKLNYELGSVYEGPLDSFDSNDQKIFDKLKNESSSISSYFNKILNYSSDHKVESSPLYFGDGSIRIQKNEENKYELINIKTDEVLDVINKFYFANNPIYNLSDDKNVYNFPILYCIGNKGYISICFAGKESYININENLQYFDLEDQSIFNDSSTEWTILN